MSRTGATHLIRLRLKSFQDAGKGSTSLLSTEPNARIHVVAAVVVVFLGILLGVSAEDWRWLVLMIGWVFFAEAVNTAIEQLCDVVTKEFHPVIKIAKDVAAAAVLISAFAAVIIGGMVFLPYIF